KSAVVARLTIGSKWYAGFSAHKRIDKIVHGDACGMAQIGFRGTGSAQHRFREMRARVRHAAGGIEHEQTIRRAFALSIDQSLTALPDLREPRQQLAKTGPDVDIVDWLTGFPGGMAVWFEHPTALHGHA